MSEEQQKDDLMAEAGSVADGRSGEGEQVRALPLLIGGLAEAGDLLRAWVQEEAADKPEGSEAVRQAALGLAVKSAERADRRMRAAANVSGRFGKLLFAPGRAVARSRPLRPLRRRFDRLVERGEAEVESWIARGQETETEGRQMVRATVGRGTREIVGWVGGEPAVEELIDKQLARIVPELADVPQLDEAVQRLADRYIAYLSQQPPQALEELLRAQIQWAIADLYQNPPPALRQLVREQVEEILPELLGMRALDELVRQVADNYIAYLNEHPEKVQSLIQDQGDVYITYLTRNPEQVQTLIQGQSKGLVSEVTDEVRARTVSADNLVETLARSILRRGKRGQLASGEVVDAVAEKEEKEE